MCDTHTIDDLKVFKSISEYRTCLILLFWESTFINKSGYHLLKNKIGIKPDVSVLFNAQLYCFFHFKEADKHSFIKESIFTKNP